MIPGKGRPSVRRDHRALRRLTGAALLLGSLSSGWGCGPAPPSVTLIGIDGATWHVMDPMLERGELPNLAGLIESGVRAPLRSELPLISPPIWTTVATGLSRERHGIRDFSSESGFASSRDRRTPALWTIASHHGLRSAVLGWWATFPAERIDGVMVSERALKTRESDIAEMFEGIPGPAADWLTHPPDAFHTLSEIEIELALPPLLASAPEQTRVLGRMRLEDAVSARALLAFRDASGPFDLELLLLRGVDPVSHFFWRYHEPGATVYDPAQRPGADDVARWGDVVEGHYRYVDDLLGQLLADSPPSGERVVLVVSDHGFEAGAQPFRSGQVLSGTHDSEQALDGIFIASGGPIRAHRTSGADDTAERVSIYDVAPTVLRLLDLPVAAELEGRVMDEILDPEWAARHPLTPVERYAMPATALPPGAGSASPADARLGNELRALGYIE